MKYKSGWRNNSRESGIELLKIIAIFLIILSHITQTYEEAHNLGLSSATEDIYQLILASFFPIGALGNNIFFICSAWFLLEQDNIRLVKIRWLIYDNWLISVVILVVFFLRDKSVLTGSDILHSCLPTLYTCNWYISCYIIFYCIHIFLNNLIKGLSKKELLRLALITGFIYIFVNWIHDGLMFYTSLVLWITVYIILAYFKKFLPLYTNNLKLNMIVLVITCLVRIVLFITNDMVGLKFGSDKVNLLRWETNCSPFLILIAFTAFNVFRHFDFKSNVINYLSGLSLYIYIIHANFLVEKYCRYKYISLIAKICGIGNDVTICLVSAFITFIVSVIISSIYFIFSKYIHEGFERLYRIVFQLYEKQESKLLD